LKDFRNNCTVFEHLFQLQQTNLKSSVAICGVQLQINNHVILYLCFLEHLQLHDFQDPILCKPQSVYIGVI